MPKLPRISGDDAIKVLKHLGFRETRQRGSHVVMRRGDKGCVVPRHKELATGTLTSIIKQSGISMADFIAAYHASR